jgi:transcriptional regulator with XRE-family HTH domain
MSTTSNIVTSIVRPSASTQRFRDAFRDHDYADAYARDFLNSTIATQIKVLREQREWTQEELAGKAEMKQPRIAVLEDVNYSSWSVSTLWRLARAFHVRLKITFEEYGTLPDELESLSRSSLQRRPLEQDPAITGEQGVQPLVQDPVPVSGFVVRTAGGSGTKCYIHENLANQLRCVGSFDAFFWSDPVSAIGVEPTRYTSNIAGGAYVVCPRRSAAALPPAQPQAARNTDRLDQGGNDNDKPASVHCNSSKN